MKLNKFCLSAAALTELTEMVLDKKASFRFQVKGFSMSPFIKDSDIVTISPASVSSIGLGKPVAFMHSETEKLIIHRVVGKKENFYIIKGDGMLEKDSLTPRKNILGVVTKIERNGKRVFLSLGFERFIVAFLSRKKFLPFIFRAWRFIPLSVRKIIL